MLVERIQECFMEMGSWNCALAHINFWESITVSCNVWQWYEFYFNFKLIYVKLISNDFFWMFPIFYYSTIHSHTQEYVVYMYLWKLLSNLAIMWHTYHIGVSFGLCNFFVKCKKHIVFVYILQRSIPFKLFSNSFHDFQKAAFCNKNVLKKNERAWYESKNTVNLIHIYIQQFVWTMNFQYVIKKKKKCLKKLFILVWT